MLADGTPVTLDFEFVNKVYPEGKTAYNTVAQPIEYNSHTHHTNLDTYERVVEDDVKKAAVIVASTVYHLSMRDEALPRFTPGDMPPPPAPRESRQ